MTEMSNKEETYGEMDLGEILRELYRGKWLIFGVTLLVGLAAAGITLMKPNVYESSAALIIREPRTSIVPGPESPVTDDAPTLSVETLQILTESTEVTWTLFEELWENQTLEQWKNESLDKQEEFRQFQDSLTTELKRQQTRIGSSISLLPILVLKARAQSPVDAQAIANQWAQIVEDKSREIYTEGVNALDVFIGDMYKQSNESLEKYEKELGAKTVEAALDLKQVRLNAIKDKSTALEEDIFEINTDLAVNDVIIKGGKRRVAEEQHEEEWIGTVAEAASISGEAYPFDKESLSPQAQKIVELVQQKVKQAESLRAYRRGQNLLSKQNKFDHYQLDLGRILTEKAKVDDELPSMQAALGALSDQIKTIPEKITLDKAITDDALWNAHISGSLPENTALAPLKSETVNPLYQSTRLSIVDLTSQIEGLKGSSEQLAKSAEAAALFIADIESEIDTIQREIERRQKELEATEGVLTLLCEDYVTEMKRVEELTTESARKQEELEIKEELRKTIAKGVDDLEKDVSKYELEIDALAREVAKTKGVQIALASQAEEVALLQVSAENASRTGTTILYSAEANPLKVAPARTKIVLASMLVAFMLCGFLVCSAKMIRTES